jgi:L-threonylcarbamoyladenylate synthase
MKVFKEFTPEVTRLLKFGAVGVIPTDTVYGIATPLLQMYSVRKLASLKGRPVDKPIGTILIDSLSQIEDIVHSSLLQKATIYWPGPVSVVLPVWSEMIYAHKSKDSLPFRMPDNQVLRELVAQTGPLATTSANLADQKTANTVEEAMKIFGDDVDFYVDGGDLSERKASKIIRISQRGEVEVLRG